jgi:hypothetical protein
MLPIESYNRISKKVIPLKDDMNLFDWKYYIYIHKDLYQNGITTKEKAYKHWINHGKNENRLHRFMNNLEMYIDNIKDLLNNNHINKEKAWELLDDFTSISDNINNEQIKIIVDNENEKRLNKYKDKKHLDYIEHATFLNFDWEFYIENNKDLIIHKVNNKEKAWKHWITYGKYENRRFKIMDNNDDNSEDYSFQNDKYAISHERNKKIEMKSLNNYINNDKMSIYEEQQIKNYYLNDNYNFNTIIEEEDNKNNDQKDNNKINTTIKSNNIYHSKIIKDRIIKDKILKYSISKNNNLKNKFASDSTITIPKIINNTVSKNQILHNKNKLVKPKIKDNNNNLLDIKKEVEKDKKIILTNNVAKNKITKNKLDKKIIINEENEIKLNIDSIENNIIKEEEKIDFPIIHERQSETESEVKLCKISLHNLPNVELNKLKQENILVTQVVPVTQLAEVSPVIPNIIKSNEKIIIEHKKKLKDNKNKLDNKIDNELLFNKIISNIINNKIIKNRILNNKKKNNKVQIISEKTE